jgi:hypothetical protein
MLFKKLRTLFEKEYSLFLLKANSENKVVRIFFWTQRENDHVEVDM